MSVALKEFESSVIEPLLHVPDSEARIILDGVAAELGYININDKTKGEDIGRYVVDGLIRLGKRPERPPIFSVDEQQEKLDGFLSQFNVRSLYKLITSLPVHIGGCSVEVEEVMKWSELDEREITLGLALPAIRIHFVPQEY